MKNKSFCENFEGNAVAEKSYAFALRVIKLRRYLAENYKEYNFFSGNAEWHQYRC